MFHSVRAETSSTSVLHRAANAAAATASGADTAHFAGVGLGGAA
ncbi:hypothetical protein [Cellulomonas sp.]